MNNQPTCMSIVRKDCSQHCKKKKRITSYRKCKTSQTVSGGVGIESMSLPDNIYFQANRIAEIFAASILFSSGPIMDLIYVRRCI